MADIASAALLFLPEFRRFSPAETAWLSLLIYGMAVLDSRNGAKA
jgi:hypothetical protein